jgi:hypothetical protein
LFVLGTFLMCMTPFFDLLKPYKNKHNGEKNRLMLSGDFYIAFTIIDCFVVWSSSTIFILLEAFFVGKVFTANYALPFIFLQMIPIYGFFKTVVSCFKTKLVSYVPVVYNLVFLVVMSLCITTSMLHVCAIPGVSTMCVTTIPHTIFYTNVFVCGPYVIFMFAISIGLVYSSCTPSVLAKHMSVL